MSTRPSYMNSTFSIMSLIALIGYVGLCVYLHDIVNLKEVVIFLLGGYGMKKGTEISGGKNEPSQKV